MNSNPIVNAVISFIIPGLGQIINDYKKRGLILLAGALLLNLLIYFHFNNAFGSIVGRLYGLYAAYDAYKLVK